ncbi:MAG: archease [Proteobacteria bacterium]|nr:archease [Pseudomonadota bacterium]
MPERKLSYQPLDHKSDTGFSIEAPSLQRLYIDAASALTDLMVKLDLIEENEKRTISVEAPNKEQLLVKWLNEILFLFEKDKFLSKKIVFDFFDGKKITASLFGEFYQPVRHGHVSEIKAVTFHQLELGMRSEPEHSFFAKVFLDL